MKPRANCTVQPIRETFQVISVNNFPDNNVACMLQTMTTAVSNEDIWGHCQQCSDNLFLPNTFDVPSAAKRTKFRKRYSRSNPCLCKRLSIESKIIEADTLYSYTKPQKKVRGSEKSGNRHKCAQQKLFYCLKQWIYHHDPIF